MNALALHVFDPDDPPEKPRRSRRRLPDFLREEELTALFAAAFRTWQETPARQAYWRKARERDWLMIQLAYYCGLRVAELCDLEIADVDLAGRVLVVREGKGGVDGSVPIPAKLSEPLRAWIAGRTVGVLFTDPRGRRVHTRHFRSQLKRMAALAGIVRRCNPHVLRHSYGTHLLRHGATIYEVKSLMRHADISTTQVYLHFAPGRLADVVETL